MNGIINVYKEKGFTSFDVVAKLRGILHQKKIGHTGTLDPEAEGVLPVCLGNATKVCDMLTNKDKTYQTVMKLGLVTDTQDMTGTVLQKRNVHVTREEIQRAVMSFLGEYEQIPPMYSAKKINGKKLYEIAREGKVIERKPCKVCIHSIQINDINLEKREVTMIVSCSKGTYIRTLCHDIGTLLECGACMKSLLRTQVSQFRICDSMKLSEIEYLVSEDLLEEKVVAVDQVLSEYAGIIVLEKADRLLYNGNAISEEMIARKEKGDISQYRVYDSEHTFVGIYQWNDRQHVYKPAKMFLP